MTFKFCGYVDTQPSSALLMPFFKDLDENLYYQRLEKDNKSIVSFTPIEPRVVEKFSNKFKSLPFSDQVEGITEGSDSYIAVKNNNLVISGPFNSVISRLKQISELSPTIAKALDSLFQSDLELELKKNKLILR